MNADQQEAGYSSEDIAGLFVLNSLWSDPRSSAFIRAHYGFVSFAFSAAVVATSTTSLRMSNPFREKDSRSSAGLRSP
jgi:hypothetical protein